MIANLGLALKCVHKMYLAQIKEVFSRHITATNIAFVKKEWKLGKQ